jgi:hypothetical protein
MVDLLLLIKYKLALEELVKNSGDIDGLDLNLILLLWLKVWVMVSLWLVLLLENKLWINIKLYSLIHLVVDISNVLSEWKS